MINSKRIFEMDDAIRSLRPGTAWVMVGTEYSDIQWFDQKQEKPTESELLQEIDRLQQEYDTTEYQRKRIEEYPSIGDQLDALYKAGLFPEELAAQIQAVKDKYPKG